MPIYKKKTINNTPTKIPLSAPQGYPVGTIIMRYKKICPRNCVYLDGRDTTGTAEELETVYPALYMFLGGTNVLPDYRECTMVGAEQNTTDTIASHDVYTEGEFKDDQIQNITGTFRGLGYSNGAFGDLGHVIDTVPTTGGSGIYENMNFDASRVARAGDTTHGKQKAVYYYMVAVEGCMIADEDDFINVIKNYIDTTQSYSPTEHFTGKYWKDGKKIYSKTVDCGALPNATSKNINHGITNIDRITKIECNSSTSAGLTISIPYTPLDILGNGVGLSVDKTTIYLGTGVDRSNFTDTVCTLEYTKTT